MASNKESMREKIYEGSDASQRFFFNPCDIVQIGHKRYLINSSERPRHIDIEQKTALVSVIDTPRLEENLITEKSLLDATVRLREDDEFCKEFLQIIIFFVKKPFTINLTLPARYLLQRWGTEDLIGVTTESDDFYRGPHIVIGNVMYDVWRIHRDDHKTFQVTLRPGRLSGSGNGSSNLQISAPMEYEGGEIPVPSRLRESPSDQRSLADLRIVVKDNFDVCGIRTGLGNKAYAEIGKPASQTAKSIERLVQMGAKLVAKTKLAPFGLWHEPMEYIDYEAPWNPRADGFQSPGGSSSGSACAVAAYDWVDIAIGSDTAGSIMRPALWAGVFGMRPTVHALSHDGMVPSIELLDTPGFFMRDLELGKRFASAWYGDKLSEGEDQSFTRIIWPSDYWATIEFGQVRMATRFAEELKSFLGIPQVVMSFEHEWNQRPPIEAPGVGLREYMQEATEHAWYDDHHRRREFWSEYRRQHGREPYMTPPVRKLWETMENVTMAQRNEARRRLETFDEWFDDIVMRPGFETSILLLPIENLEPRYRDETLDDVKKPGPGINSLFLSPVSGTPELIVPIGEVPYSSRVSGNEEKLVFAIGVIAPRCMDLQLMNTVYECLIAAGRPTKVQTGRFAFRRE